MKNSKLLVALVLAGMAAMATAQTNNFSGGGNGQGGGQGDGGKKASTPQAIAACHGKSSGASCSFVGRNNNSLSGRCFTPNADRPLGCRPAQGTKHQRGQGDGQGGGQGRND